MVGKVAVLALVVVLGWAYQAIQPPPPDICGSPNGPPITSPRILLSDGRHLSYREAGVPKEKAKYRVIIVHGFDSSKEMKILPSQELVEELGIYFLHYDRAGYGESDPNPKRSVKSEAMDIQELTDRMAIGEKFYLMGHSMGGYPTWACLRHIPHRLAGAVLVAPAVSYWWPSLPIDLSREVYRQLLVRDQVAFWIARHVPSLLYLWMTQKLFPSCSIVEKNPVIFNRQDLKILKNLTASKNSAKHNHLQQGVFESMHRDLMVMFGKWDFDPTDVANPFPQNNGSVHLWQGYEDKLVPFQLQRHVASKLPWIHYHECSECGHLFIFSTDWSNRILKALLIGEVREESSAP